MHRLSSASGLCPSAWVRVPGNNFKFAEVDPSTTIDSRHRRPSCWIASHNPCPAKYDEACSHPFDSSFCLWILTAYDDEVRRTHIITLISVLLMVVFRWPGTVVCRRCLNELVSTDIDQRRNDPEMGGFDGSPLLPLCPNYGLSNLVFSLFLNP
jgi:hypothetical protein